MILRIKANTQVKNTISIIKYQVSSFDKSSNVVPIIQNDKYENIIHAIMNNKNLQNFIIGLYLGLYSIISHISSSFNRSQQCLHFFALSCISSSQYGHLFIFDFFVLNKIF